MSSCRRTEEDVCHPPVRRDSGPTTAGLAIGALLDVAFLVYASAGGLGGK